MIDDICRELLGEDKETKVLGTESKVDLKKKFKNSLTKTINLQNLGKSQAKSNLSKIIK